MTSQELEGIIEEKLPQALYRVRLQDGRVVVASVSTQAQRVTVRFIAGDKVKLQMSPLDPTRARITVRQV